jgi:hypothetical protein
LVVRAGLTASATTTVGDKVSVYKFVADAITDNTEGEDSIKFGVTFQPQGVLGVNIALA